MAQSIEEKLLQAIEKDDIKSFNALMGESPLGAFRLGRFPVLSLLYLYNARKIIIEYEEKFLRISTWEELNEPVSVVKKFSDKAGKCLRLYLSEVVSPLEMLLILNKTGKLKKIYPLTQTSKAVKARLQSIYSVKYALEIKFEGNNIIIDRRPLSYGEKKKLAFACIGCFLIVAILVSAITTTVTLIPKEGEITKFSQIDFGAEKTYTLKKDVTIPENYSIEKVNCTIIGNGKKLILGKNATLGEFTGNISDLEIQTYGGPIFTVCTSTAVLSNVTLNINAEMEISEGSALIALTNYGTFDGITVNVSGKISAVAGNSDGQNELVFGGMVMENSYSYGGGFQINYGTIKNCIVNYSDFSLEGEVKANATFGGIVGVNGGIVQDCTINGEITADTFDLAGACYVNNYVLSGIANSADLSQVSESDGWSPIVAGIAIESSSVIHYCKNSGNIAVSGVGTAICGGIVATTYGQNNYCLSSGNITVNAQTSFVGGIFGRSLLTTDDMYVYCGFASYCISEGKIKATLGDGKSYVGGIGGFVQEGAFKQYKYDEYGFYVVDENGNRVTETVYFGGGITNCIFIGGIEGTFDYFGNIVGLCGANIYEKNSYTSNGTKHSNFSGNYYIGNNASSFGAVITADEDYVKVEDKGATLSTENEIKNTNAYNNILKALGIDLKSTDRDG